MEPFEIEALLAIMDLVARYNRAGDTGRSEDFKELFTGSGVFEMNGGRTAQGGQAIETLMEDVKRQFATAPAIFFPARHHVSGLTIDFADSDHATGREGCESFDHARTVAFDYMASVVSSFEEEGYEFLGDWKIQDELTVAHDLTYESNTLFPESEVLIIEIGSEISSHTHPVEFLWFGLSPAQDPILDNPRRATSTFGVVRPDEFGMRIIWVVSSGAQRLERKVTGHAALTGNRLSSP